MKNKKILDAKEAAKSTHVSLQTVVAQEARLLARKKVSCICTNDFRNLDEKHEIQGSEDLCESVNLLL